MINNNFCSKSLSQLFYYYTCILFQIYERNIPFRFFFHFFVFYMKQNTISIIISGITDLKITDLFTWNVNFMKVLTDIHIIDIWFFMKISVLAALLSNEIKYFKNRNDIVFFLVTLTWLSTKCIYRSDNDKQVRNKKTQIIKKKTV